MLCGQIYSASVFISSKPEYLFSCDLHGEHHFQHFNAGIFNVIIPYFILDDLPAHVPECTVKLCSVQIQQHGAAAEELELDGDRNMP